KRLLDTLIGPSRAKLAPITFEQDVRMLDLTRFGLACFHHLLQCLTLLGSQCYRIFLHGGLLSGSSGFFVLLLGYLTHSPFCQMKAVSPIVLCQASIDTKEKQGTLVGS